MAPKDSLSHPELTEADIAEWMEKDLGISAPEFLSTVIPADLIDDGETATFTTAKEHDGRLIFVTRPFKPNMKIKKGTHYNAGIYSTDGVDPQTGNLTRTVENLVAIPAIVLDDVGEKTKLTHTELPVPPSFVIETKPDSFQVGYLLKDPIEDLETLDSFLYSMGVAEMTDPGTTKLNQVFRLPGSLPPGKIYPARLIIWQPGNVYTLDEIRDRYNVAEYYRGLQASGADPLPEGTVVDCPMTDWVMGQDFYQGPGRRGYLNIECPWQHKHTDKDRTDGAGFHPPTAQEPWIGFRCFHGHCEARSGREFIDWAVIQGGPDVDVVYRPKTDLTALQALGIDLGVDWTGTYEAIDPRDDATNDRPDPEPERDTKIATNSHLHTARSFVARNYWHNDQPTLACWQDTFYRWVGPHWEECLPKEIEREVWMFIATRCYLKGGKIPRPGKQWVAEVTEAMKADLARDGRLDFGWKPGCPLDHLTNAISVQNGILDLDTMELHPHTPDLFNVVSIAAPLLPRADLPVFEDTKFGRWIAAAVTHQNGTGADQLPVLQEWTGYLISSQTNMQKIGMITGPRRSGKGTYGRILNGLLGGTTASISSTQLQGSFPLQNLIGKTVAILPDVRIDRNTKQGQLAEVLLSVSGEDPQSVQRKFKIDWNGILSVRFLMMSNSVPRLMDHDGVLFSRFIFIEFPNSHFGEEDETLTDRLMRDRAVILRWALDGYIRLRRQRQFSTSATHKRVSEQALVRMDPVGRFIDSWLDVTGGDDWMPFEDLEAGFFGFCEAHNMNPFSTEGFAKVFWAKDVDGVVRRRERVDNGKRDRDGNVIKDRVRGIAGIRWRDGTPATKANIAQWRMDRAEDDL
nr:DUF5906 domain-containing protein [uncultured Ruegeria sp.]